MKDKMLKKSLLATMFTFAISSLSATIVFPVLAPLFLSPTESILAAPLPDNIRSILLGFFLAAFPLAQFIFSPLAGEYADRKGRKKAFLITLSMEVLGYLLSALGIATKHLSILFVGRFITGLAAGNMSVCLATIVDLSPNQKSKVRYFSIGSAIAGVMFVLGPFIGGKLSDSQVLPFFNLAFPMWVGAALALINFLVMLFLFRETLAERESGPFDALKSVHNVQLAFQTRQVRDLYFVYFFFLFAWNMLYQFMPAVMVEEFQARTSLIGDVSAIMGGVWVLGTVCVMLLMHTSLRLKYFMIASFLVFSAIVVFIPYPIKLSFFLILTAIAVFCIGAVWPIFTGAISNAADQGIQGKILGISQSIQSLSMMLAPFFGGFFLQAHSSVPFAISAISALIAAALLTKTKSDLLQH